MKKTIIIVILAIAFSVNSYSQFSFGVSPGITTNSASFGYKAGNIVPWVGFQLVNGGFTNEYKDHYYDGSQWVDDVSKMTVNVNLLMPSIGVKFFAIDKGDLKAYFNLAGTKPLIRGTMKNNDTENEDFAENLKKVNIFGAELGFGAEYFFSKNFSLGGEYSLRYLGGNHTEKDEYSYNGETAVETDKFTVRVAPTIAKLSLNFYFGGGDN